jgi:PTH1 family peptidyl-tRNA hydrolase
VMKIIVGLGNPGKKFEKTRHNLGFMVVESFKSKFKNFSNWKKSKKFLSEISEGKIDNERVILVKPQTFMNNSGPAVKRILEKLRTSNVEHLMSNLWVIHDDLDIPFGKIKISFGRGSAGHKGVQSIIDEIGTKDFVRFRIGIGKKEVGIRKKEFVLEKFSKNKEKILKKVIEMASQAIEMAIKEGIEKAMSEFNK